MQKYRSKSKVIRIPDGSEFKLPTKPNEFDARLNKNEEKELEKKWDIYNREMNTVYKHFFFTRPIPHEDTTILPKFDEDGSKRMREILLKWLFGGVDESGVINDVGKNLKPEQKEWIKNCTKEIIRRYVKEINKKYNNKNSPPYEWKRTLIQAIGILAFNFALSINSYEWMPISRMSWVTDKAYSIEDLNFIQNNMINLLGGRFCPEYMKKPGGIMEKKKSLKKNKQKHICPKCKKKKGSKKKSPKIISPKIISPKKKKFYIDNASNRKLARVGKPYGKSKKRNFQKRNFQKRK